MYPRGLKSGIIKKRFETRHSIANQNTFYIYWFSIKLQNVTKNGIQEKKSLKGLIYREVYNRMYFGPINGARTYKWVGSLYVGVFPPHPFFKGKALGTRLGRGLYVGWSLYVGGGRLIRVCVWGGGGL